MKMQDRESFKELRPTLNMKIILDDADADDDNSDLGDSKKVKRS